MIANNVVKRVQYKGLVLVGWVSLIFSDFTIEQFYVINGLSQRLAVSSSIPVRPA